MSAETGRGVGTVLRPNQHIWTPPASGALSPGGDDMRSDCIRISGLVCGLDGPGQDEESRAGSQSLVRGLEGQASYRLAPASVGTESSSPLGSQSSRRQVERSRLSSLGFDFDLQVVGTSRNGSSRTQTAQAMRASLFARAIVALL